MRINFRADPLQENTDGGTGGGSGVGSTVGKTTEEAAAGSTIVTGGKEGETAAAGKKPGDTAGKEGEGKKADETGAGAAGKETGGKAGDTKTPKAPAKYELTIPDGGRLDESDLKYVEDAARNADMTNEEAQAWIVEQDNAVAEQAARFLAETKADKEIGGDKLEATTQLARAGIDRLFPKGDAHRDGFMKFLNRGGAGNNIHVVRALARIGKLTAEDTATGGRGGGGGEGDAASKLYDKSQ